MHHTTTQTSPRSIRQAATPQPILDKVYNGRIAEVAPDDLWQVVESINRTIATMTELVDKVEAHLASIDYTPPSSG